MQSNRIRVVVALWIALTAVACHKRPPTAIVRPPIPPPDQHVVIMSPVATLAPIEPRVDIPQTFFSPLDQAELEFDKGNYDAARTLYEDAFTDDHFKDKRDLILFKLGLTYVVPISSRGNWQAAAEKFKKLDEYQSPFKWA